MTFNRITVVGAGTMGNGIAHVFAQHGFNVTLCDPNQAQLDFALETISKNLDRQLQKGKLTQESKAASLNNIETSTHPKLIFPHSDLIIEAVPENISIKREVFKQIGTYKSKHCLVASNTSSLSITALGAMTQTPEQFIGMHFMNPVPVMPLVEVIVGHRTAQKTVDAVVALSQKINKKPFIVNDYPGFIANRIALPMINEAIEALEQGVGGVLEIDQIMKLGMGHPMGPLQLADFIGLDVCLAILEILHKELGKDKYAPSILLRKMVLAQHLGRKSGIGFYDYQSDIKNPTIAPQFT